MSRRYTSPLELVHRYHNLKAQFFIGRTVCELGFSVTQYRATTDSQSSPQMVEKERIIERLCEVLGGRRRSEIPIPPEWQPLFSCPAIRTVEIAHALNVRGSPEEIENTITVVMACGYKPAGDVARIRQFIDEFIGLDCCGFVGNYLAANGVRFGGSDEDPVPGPASPPSDYPRWGKTVCDAFHILADDILLFPRAPQSPRHIAIVNSVAVSGGMFQVCESHGGTGLDARYYRLVEFRPRDSVPGVIMGTETLPAAERKTFRFLHPAGKELDLMVRRIVPWNPPLS